MSHFPFHPAPGFGDLAPGFFVLPQNPIHNDGTPLVPSIQATAPGKAVRIPRLAELVAASFVVPENPLVHSNPMGLAGLRGLGCGCGQGCGGGFGCDGGTNFYALNGLEGIGDDVTGWLTAPSPASGILGVTVPNWALYGGAAALLYFVFGAGGSEYRAKSSALRAQYRGYRRAARYTAGRLQQAAA